MWWKLISTFGLGLLLIGQPAFSQTSVDRGRSLAQKHCARCHAVSPTGASPMGLAPPFRTLSQRYPVESLAEALAEGIVTGHPAMPQFVFEPRDIDALLNYIAGLSPSAEDRVRRP
jgi:mono/diheme cytochrome c family protein